MRLFPFSFLSFLLFLLAVLAVPAYAADVPSGVISAPTAASVNNATTAVPFYLAPGARVAVQCVDAAVWIAQGPTTVTADASGSGVLVPQGSPWETTTGTGTNYLAVLPANGFTSATCNVFRVQGAAALGTRGVASKWDAGCAGAPGPARSVFLNAGNGYASTYSLRAGVWYAVECYFGDVSASNLAKWFGAVNTGCPNNPGTAWCAPGGALINRVATLYDTGRACFYSATAATLYLFGGADYGDFDGRPRSCLIRVVGGPGYNP